MIQPKVALSKEFMEAYSQLPRKTQKKVREFTVKFQQDPTQPGLNIEPIEGAVDPKVRSVRVDQAYRAIVVHPPRGDVYLCVWVDHHDEAYAWARRKRFEVNPRSGTFQLFESFEGEPLPQLGIDRGVDLGVQAPSIEAPQEVGQPQTALFGDFDDEDLLMAGVPLILLPAIRGLQTEADLDQISPHLPRDADDMLYLLAAGYTLVDAMEEMDQTRPKVEQVDVEDFTAALERPEAKQSFKIVEHEEELEAILDAPLEQWRVFLHPTQRALVQMDTSGPVRVLGGAGTGKTVVLMHRANHLASNVFKQDTDRILVTTFTRNLALNLEANLEYLCPGDACRRLEVLNLHRWAYNFMQKQGHSFRVLQNEKRRKELFEEAFLEASDLDFPPAFYLEEWDRVVQPQDIDSRDAYLTARRVGRGTPLRKKQRLQVWEVLGRYRELLDAQGMVEWADVIRETRLFIQKQNVRLPYRAVLSDEVQDFGENELRLLRTIAPEGRNNLFLVGDAHQRIFGHPVVMSHCGIEIRGRSRRLKLNYRTTEEIRHQSVALLEGKEIDDLDGGADSMKGFRSLRNGPNPEVFSFSSEQDEANQVEKTLRGWLDAGVSAESICLAARTHELLEDRYGVLLKNAGFETVQVETDPKSESKKRGVRLSTMHRMKGLEFSRVLIAGVQDGTVPLPVGPTGDELSAAEHELRERSLLYVACTRARDELVITGFGGASPFLAQ